MTKKVKPAKKAKKPADKTPEITKAAKALENYLKENNLDPAKDWSKDKTHGKAVKELMAKLNKERDKVAAQYPEKDTANQKKLGKMKKASEPYDSEAPVEIGFKPRSFLPAAAFYLTSVSVKKTQTNLLIFPLSSCEPNCSAAVWFRTKPLRFPTGGFLVAR